MSCWLFVAWSDPRFLDTVRYVFSVIGSTALLGLIYLYPMLEGSDHGLAAFTDTARSTMPHATVSAESSRWANSVILQSSCHSWDASPKSNLNLFWVSAETMGPDKLIRERYAASVLTRLLQDLTITMTRDVNTVTLFPKILMGRGLLYTHQLFQWWKRLLRHWYSDDYITHPEVCTILYGLDFHSNNWENENTYIGPNES
jgi:hypothetical protein